MVTTVESDHPPVQRFWRPGIRNRGYRYGPRVIRRLADGQRGGPYHRFDVRPAGPLIGAEIVGVDLARPLTPEVFTELDRALLEWKVLFFRNQRITARQQRDFAAMWGTIDSHPFFPKTTPSEVIRLEKGAANAGVENVWHFDFPWIERPPMGAVLRMLEAPELGGDTLFADAAAAYDNLPEEVRERIDGLYALHDFASSGNYRTFFTPEDHERFEKLFPPVSHPLVRTHPVTDRKTLFVSSINTTEIIGLPPDEGEELLRYLVQQMQYADYQVRFRWEPDSVVFWDNRAVTHYACSDYYPRRRVVDRVAIAGDRPV
jgi:taurine dioxygenase